MRKGEKRSLYAGTVTRTESPKPYEYRGRDDTGRQVRRRFRTIEQVEAFDRKLDGRKARRKNGLPEERDPITLAALIAIYVEQHQVSPQTLATLKFNLRHAQRAFGNTIVTNLRPEEIARWNANLGLAPTTRGHALKALRQVLSAGVEWGYLSINPARPSRTVRTPRATRKPIKPFQSWAEVVRVANAAGSKWGPLIRFVCATGLREQEWLALRWSDLRINAKRPRLYVRRTVRAGEIEDGVAKTENSHRVVLLYDRALAALRELPRPLDAQQLIFPGTKGGILDVRAWSRKGKNGKRQGPWRRALDAANVEYRPPGQMRHTYATLALSQWHAPIQTVSEQLGHGDIKVTLDHYSGYVTTADDHYLALLNAPEPDVSETCQSTGEATES
jgi:integrase